MIRLYVVCEGLTEVNFVTTILKPHLEARTPDQIAISAPNLKGHCTYARLKKFVRNLLHSPAHAVIVTTMIDLFEIAGDFPGTSDPYDDKPGEHRVQYLEQCCSEDIGDERFLPYLQLHEFEALVLTDLDALAEQYPNQRNEIHELAKRLRDLPPEQVNRLSPPSRRIKQSVPEYSKTVGGLATVVRIGLSTLRARCPHFGPWIDCLENLASESPDAI